MEDPFISFDEVKNELRVVSQLGIDLSNNLAILEQKIKYIFSKIQECETLLCAEPYFIVLDEIQQTLAGLVFREGIGISKRLRQFVSDFDNFEYVKAHYFKKVKDGTYSF